MLMEESAARGLLLAYLLLVSSRLLLAATPLLGVSAQDEKYLAGSVIACKDGSRSFSRDRLNDGFCDCPDGTDEPGTSACPESKFYCKNTGDTPQLLFSSRVNDFICDCCDGSDEYGSGIYCPNTCRGDRVPPEDKIENFNIITTRFHGVNILEKGTRDELEDLIGQLKGLKVMMIVMFMVTFCTCYRRMKHRSRLSLLKQ